MSRKKSIFTKYYQPLRGSVDDDKRTGHRIYRLKGYTTVDKINRKFAQERYQRTLRNTLTFIMIVILLVILFVIYNPFTDVGELKRSPVKTVISNNTKRPRQTAQKSNSHK